MFEEDYIGGDVRRFLEGLYVRYNRRDLVHPDPLEFLYNYPNPRDREIAGLIASSLAYGRVSQILKATSSVLECIGTPYDFLMSASLGSLKKIFSGFRYRFTTGEELAHFLYGIKCVIEEYGSLYRGFADCLGVSDETVLPAMILFIERLYLYAGFTTSSLLPLPSGKSAFKRFCLFLRWMVRKDDVDIGDWEDIGSSKLLVPLDTHMYSFASRMGFTNRKQADIRTVLEITEHFRRISPSDPVKYDFAITRLGILGGKLGV